MSLPEMSEGATNFDRRVAEFIARYEELCKNFGMMVGMDTRNIGPLKVDQYVPYVVIWSNQKEIDRAVLEMRVTLPLLFRDA